MSFVVHDDETYIIDVDARSVFHRGRLCPCERDAPADLHVGIELVRRRLHDLLGFDEVGDVTVGIGSASVEATTYAMDTATGDEGESEGDGSRRQ